MYMETIECIRPLATMKYLMTVGYIMTIKFLEEYQIAISRHTIGPNNRGLTKWPALIFEVQWSLVTVAILTVIEIRM